MLDFRTRRLRASVVALDELIRDRAGAFDSSFAQKDRLEVHLDAINLPIVRKPFEGLCNIASNGI